MSAALLLQAFLLGGCHTATHTRGQPKVWGNHRLLNALNIGGLIGSVEKGSPDSKRTHMHAHKISLLLLPNYLATAENERKLLTAQIGLTVNQPFSRQSKIVGQNSPQGQNKLRLPKGFLTFLNLSLDNSSPYYHWHFYVCKNPYLFKTNKKSSTTDVFCFSVCMNCPFHPNNHNIEIRKGQTTSNITIFYKIY